MNRDSNFSPTYIYVIHVWCGCHAQENVKLFRSILSSGQELGLILTEHWKVAMLMSCQYEFLVNKTSVLKFCPSHCRAHCKMMQQGKPFRQHVQPSMQSSAVTTWHHSQEFIARGEVGKSQHELFTKQIGWQIQHSGGTFGIASYSIEHAQYCGTDTQRAGCQVADFKCYTPACNIERSDEICVLAFICILQWSLLPCSTFAWRWFVLCSLLARSFLWNVLALKTFSIRKVHTDSYEVCRSRGSVQNHG